MSDLSASNQADDEDAVGVPPLGVDIEHIADSSTWAEQAWRLIRERREHERKEVEDRERARLDEQAKRRKDEKEWRERQTLLSQQRAAAIDSADLPSSSAHRRAQTARREGRDKQGEVSAIDVHAGAMSVWQQRGLLHMWSSDGSKEQQDKERREIWDGHMRGKRAQLDKLDAERRRQAEQRPKTKQSNQPRRPQTAAAACRPTTASTQTSHVAAASWAARPHTAATLPPPTRPVARPCIRCALPATSFLSVALVALVAEHEHLSRLLHHSSSSSAALPAAVRRLHPRLSSEQYAERCSDSTWLERQVEVCHECAEWLDDNKHITARRTTLHSSHSSSSGSTQCQQHGSTSDSSGGVLEDVDSSDDDEDSARSITQLVNRVLAMPAPTHSR